MAALMRLRVIPAQGDAYEINITPKVIVEAERHFAKPMSDLFGESASFEALCFAAWKGCQISGRSNKTFDEWLDEVDSIEAGEQPRVPLETPSPS
jgi:hypothetical protein